MFYQLTPLSTQGLKWRQTALLIAIISFSGLSLSANARDNTTAPGQAGGSPASQDMRSMPGMEDSKPMSGMHDSMSTMPMTGDPDHDFAMMMRKHHQDGIKMAETEREQGKDPEMRRMAQKIIAAQKKELAAFDRWLKRHEKPTSNTPSKSP